MRNEQTYDALLMVAFGGPEGPEDVMPFLENVTRGRNIPRERLLEVAEHYQHFGGRSPINDQVRALIAALRPALAERGIGLPVYWGNRNWHPMLADTVRQMVDDGVQRALAIVLAAYSSYSSCRQYRENITDACAAVGSSAPVVDKVRVFYNHPDFVAANADRVRESMERLSAEPGPPCLVFTAHSIPSGMAASCDYEKQLQETSRLVAEAVGIQSDRWKLVYQSRSGRPQDPWLGPDVLDYLRTMRDLGERRVVVAPVGFLSDHVEVLYDLDDEARKLADGLGMTMARAATVGTHPRFVTMLVKLVEERLRGDVPREAIGRYGPNHDVCPADCCPAMTRRA